MKSENDLSVSELSTDTQPDEHLEKLSNKERVSYGVSDFACNIANGMVGT